MPGFDRREAIRAAEANFADTWWLVAEANRAELITEPGLRWFSFEGPVPDPRTTAILDTRVGPDDADSAVARLTDHLRDRARSAIWWVTPSTSPRDLGARLESAGWQVWGRWPVMAIETADLPAMSPVEGFEIRPVRSAADRQAQHSVLDALGMAGTFDRAFEWRGARAGWSDEDAFQHVVGWLGTRAVACASTIDGGGAAGLYAVAVAEDARRRGFGRAVSLAAMHASAARGRRFGVLQTSEMGFGVYKGIGFRLVCRFTPYLLEAG